MTRKIFLYFILFILWIYYVECVQPYFPPQITFIIEESNNRYLFAVDEINQRAYKWHRIDSDDQLHAYVMQHFPYATPNSPESKNYVQLEVYEPVYCIYTAIWKYGSGMHDSFPEHWYYNMTSFKIENYMQFSSKMIHATNSSKDEDHWYSEDTCTLETGDKYPCEEIFFKKNTDIPLRYTFIEGHGFFAMRATINYKIISIGKPSDELFVKIPQNWMNNCTDLNLGLDYILPSPIINVNESATVKIRLTSPPHLVNGNDTMILQFQNFHEYQTMIVTRIKEGSETTIRPIMNGGGYDKIPFYYYRLLFR
ncbi:unnamed protein product [Rotaria sordida]|uniref:Uncharacterized protein n=1 Tax=Rotaria sordida TaxID=392033 RepID=A0A819TD85_9BILA|nr:unnamed protein product [Rotaria sordida]CAF4071046.1 unnamed protein product [Rotaria sordida]